MVSRRQLLKRLVLSAGALAALPLLEACGPSQAPAQPTAAPAPAQAAKPAAAAPTSAPAAAPTTAAQPAAKTPKRGGVLNIGQDFGPQSLDPQKQSAWASVNINELIFSGLVRWNKDMKVEPDIATSWENPDPTTYVFKLRKGVKFHNGRELTSEDVKFTFERMIAKDTASPFVSQFVSIDKIEAVDPQTVRFTLKSPFAPFVRYLATINQGSTVPKEAVDQLANQPIGTGAFAFEEHLRDQHVKLKAHKAYYEEGLPYLDGVVFKLLGDDTSISAALRSKSVDIAWLKDPKVAANVSKTTEGLRSVPGVSSRTIRIYFRVNEPPFNDVRVRQAVSLALNRKEIVETVLGGFGSVGTFLPPSQLAGYTGDGADLPYYKQDIAKAKQLLEAAGLKDGLKIPNFKVVAANALDVQCAQVMKEQWAKAGIDATINPMEVGAIIKDYQTGAFNILMIGGVWTPDPDAEVQSFYSKNPIASAIGLKDEKLDALIEKGRIEVNEQARVKVYKEIEQHALDQVYQIVPYTYPLRWELVWNYVQGYDVMASNARMSVRKTWLDK
ncbi:MAG: ABC transporter substrate-binding protein [Chloroflexi bacterium]|nr:ABC transporter substrate-binding protein [Chloroflexota bacterium]